jgi:ethanolamine utilization protein EutM
MKGQSLGLIETWGLVPAVVAADAAVKAAMVTLLGYELARGGLVTIMLAGDVAAVTAAVTAGAAAAAKVALVNSVHVIPRPDRQLRHDLPEPQSIEPRTGTPPVPHHVPSAAGPKEASASSGEGSVALPDHLPAARKAHRPRGAQKGKTGKPGEKKPSKT